MYSTMVPIFMDQTIAGRGAKVKYRNRDRPLEKPEKMT
jgi:hypothetical protein